MTLWYHRHTRRPGPPPAGLLEQLLDWLTERLPRWRAILQERRQRRDLRDTKQAIDALGRRLAGQLPARTMVDQSRVLHLPRRAPR